MAPTMGNSKGTNLSPTTLEPVGENKVAPRQRNERVVEFDPMTQVVEMIKDL